MRKAILLGLMCLLSALSFNVLADETINTPAQRAEPQAHHVHYRRHRCGVSRWRWEHMSPRQRRHACERWRWRWRHSSNKPAEQAVPAQAAAETPNAPVAPTAAVTPDDHAAPLAEKTE